MTGTVATGGWRETVLRQFTPELAALCPVTVVRDADQLMTEAGMVDGVQKAGFELHVLDDALALRLAYEQRFRQRAATAAPGLVIAVGDKVAAVPYDLLAVARESGRVVEWGLAEIFPMLSTRVVREIDRSQFDALFEAQRIFQPEVLGENATADFALRHLFRIAPELITTPTDLLRALLRLHFEPRPLAPVLADRLVALLAPRFSAWAIGDLVRSAPIFWRFLEERWPLFLRQVVGDQAEESTVTATVAGPTELPFGDPDIRVYVDDLFLDGRLRRTGVVAREIVPEPWMEAGVEADEIVVDIEVRFAELTASVRNRLPPFDAPHSEWTGFARLWAEWLVARHQLTATQVVESGIGVDALHDDVERRFGEWLAGHYAGLHNLSHWPRPVMVHHVGRYLAHRAEAARPARQRLALVVLDGLAWDQWLLLRDAVAGAVHEVADIEESAIFAWVPTLTSISRQAIFAAEAPFAFGPSLLTTAKEEIWWRRLWEDRDIERRRIAFVRQREHEGDVDFFNKVREAIENPGIYRAGIVINTLDAALHDASAETGWLHAMIRKWCTDGHLVRLVSALVASGFDTCLTADHGNIEARGIGRPNAGDVPETRGARVYAFRDPHTRHDQAARFPDAIEWPGPGLPPGYFVLVAPGRGAFMPLGTRAITHGGMSLEEVIVPFVSVTRRAG